MHYTQIKNQRSDQGITRCNQAWEYIKTKAYMSNGLSK